MCWKKKWTQRLKRGLVLFHWPLPQPWLRIHPFSTHFLLVYYVELESLELRILIITTHSKSLSVNLVKEILALNGRKMDSNFKAFYFQSVEIFFKQNAGWNVDNTDKSNFALIEAGPNIHLTPLRSPLKTSLRSIWMASKLVHKIVIGLFQLQNSMDSS